MAQSEEEQNKKIETDYRNSETVCYFWAFGFAVVARIYSITLMEIEI